LAMVHASATAVAYSHHAHGLPAAAAASCAHSWRLASTTTSRPLKPPLNLSATGAQAQYRPRWMQASAHSAAGAPSAHRRVTKRGVKDVYLPRSRADAWALMEDLKAAWRSQDGPHPVSGDVHLLFARGRCVCVCCVYVPVCG
jgi:hypothetical protein